MTMAMMMTMECSGCIGKGGRGQVPSHSVTKHHIYNADHDNHYHRGVLMMILVIIMIMIIMAFSLTKLIMIINSEYGVLVMIILIVVIMMMSEFS